MPTEAGTTTKLRDRRIVAFMDLDDTVFQTPRKCAPGELHPATLTREGLPGSFFTTGQRVLVELLLEHALVVPVTARDTDALARVGIPFTHGAIVSYGGLILHPDGTPDAPWFERMSGLCAAAAPLLAFVMKTIRDIIAGQSLTCRARLINDAGLDFYVVIKSDDQRVEQLTALKKELETVLRSSDVRIHLNDNNLAVLPGFLDKAPAVSYFRETRITPVLKDPLFIGLGDSFSDLAFLRQCDYMLIPSASQIAQGWEYYGVTPGSGEQPA